MTVEINQLCLWHPEGYTWRVDALHRRCGGNDDLYILDCPGGERRSANPADCIPFVAPTWRAGKPAEDGYYWRRQTVDLTRIDSWEIVELDDGELWLFGNEVADNFMSPDFYSFDGYEFFGPLPRPL